MCGVSALLRTAFNHDPAQGMALIRGMTGRIAHRGPDSDGHWQDPDYPNMLMGQRRLAIIDLSPLGAQPMASGSGRYHCVFNGEIYNYQEIETELRALGHVFRGRSDTEIVLGAVDQWGINQTLQKINGMFLFIIWDRKERTLHIMRDRLGKKPLYIGWAGSDLLMSSELKSFHVHPQFEKKVNRDVLALYMRYGYVHAPYSIYHNVWQVPPGARITLKAETLRAGENLLNQFEYYWHMPRVIEESRRKSTDKSDSTIIDEFENLLKECVRERMISDVPLGAFLSGGIDSSVVVALMQQQATQPVKTYSIGFEDPKYNEAPFAKDIATHLGTDHHEMILSQQDALNVVPLLPFMYDEPFADASQIPTYLVSKFARSEVTVALSGDGGDEMLGGYNRHTVAPAIWSKIGWMPQSARNVMASLISMVPPEQWDRMSFGLPLHGERMGKIAALLKRRSPMGVYDSLISTCGDAPVVLNGQMPLTPVNDDSWSVRGLSYAEDMMYHDALSYLPNDILVKVDRASMAVSLEARAPLLDKRIFEYVWSLPEHVKIRQGKGKWLLREVLSRHVPRTLFERPKQGFAAPITPWLRGSLRAWADDLLEPDQMRRDGLLNTDLVQSWWKAHKEGRLHSYSELWTVLMFQAWHREYK